MGLMTNVKCQCQDNNLRNGVGMLYPNTYKETIDKIKAGEYGREIQELFEKNNLLAIDAEKTLFYCEKCGHVESMMPLDVYKPKDPEAIKKKKYGIKTVEEWGEIPYWYSKMNHGGEFEKIYTHTHHCPNCGATMVKTDMEELSSKICPKCGQNYSVERMGTWD